MSFDLRAYAREREKRGQTEEKDDRRNQDSTFDLKDYAYRRKAGQVAEGITERINKWLDNSRQYCNRYNSRFVGRDTSAYVSDSDQWMLDTMAQKNSLDKEREGILADIEKYGKYMNTEWVKSITDALESGNQTQGKILDIAKQDWDFWKQWDSEDAYIKGAAEAGEEREERYENNKKRIEELREERQAMAGGQNASALATGVYIPWLDSNLGRVKDIDAEIEALQNENWNYELGEDGYVSIAEDKQRKLNATYLPKYEGKTYVQINEIIAGMEDGEEKTWLEQYAPSVMTAEDYDSEIAQLEDEIYNLQTYYLERYDNAIKNLGGLSPITGMIIDEINEKFGSRTELAEYIDRLKEKKWNYENSRKYNFLPENEDFLKNSGYVSTAADDWWSKATSQFNLGYSDLTYEYINNQNGIRDTIRRAAINTNYGMDDYDRYDHLTEEEISTYNYLYNTQGKETAEEYLKTLKITLNGRKMDQFAQNVSEFTGKNIGTGIAASAISVPANLISGIGYLDALGQKAVNDLKEDITGEYAGPVDYNRAAMMPSVASSAIRGTVSQNLAKRYGTIEFNEEDHPILSKILNGKSWGDVYQLGMSMVDSTAVALMSPVIGSAGTLMLSGSAATQTMLNAVENGATDEQALTMGALSGAFEYLFEKYELENLLKNGSENVVRAFVAQSWSEGFGEGATTIANTLADTIVMADKSEVNRIAGEYMDADPKLSKEKAMKKAWMDIAIQTGWDVVGGVASGSIMGGSYSAINHTVGSAIDKINANERYNALGRTIVGTEGGVDALKALALEMVDSVDMETQGTIRNLADQVVGDQYTGKGLGKLTAAVKNSSNTKRVGKLYDTVRSTVTQQNQADIEKSLTRKGFSERTARNIAEALVDQLNGKELSKYQEAVLDCYADNEKVQETVADIIENDRSTVSDRSASLDAFKLDLARKRIMQQVGMETAADQAELENASDVVGETPTEATLRDTGEVVKFKKFTDVTKENATVELEDGTSVPASDISFAGGEDGLFHMVATEERMDAPAANAIWQVWESIKANKLPISAERFSSAAIACFRAGLQGNESILSSSDSKVAALSQTQRKLIYDTARRAAKAKADAAQANIDAVYEQAQSVLQQNGITQKPTQQAVTVDGISVENMNRSQRLSFKMAEMIAPGIQCKIEVYNGGKEWGFYNPRTDTIRLNINAKWSRTTMLAFTLGHEMAHRAKRGSPAQFDAFAAFLVREYGKQGSSVKDMIAQQLEIAAEYDKTVPKEQRLNMTEEMALEEVVADACQRMLLDTNAGQRLAEFGAQSQQNRDFLRKFGEILRKLLKRLRSIFKNVEPDSLAAQEFMRFDANVKQILADMFVEMSIDAGEKLSTIKEAGLTEKITTENGGVRQSNKLKSSLYNEYDKPITQKDVMVLRGIGKKSIFAFTAEELQIAQKWAYKFNDSLQTKSPFFRAWFGDWRAYDKSPVSVVDIPKNATTKQRSNEGVVCKDTVNADGEGGWRIRISGHGERNTRAHAGQGKRSVEGLNNILGLVEYAVLLDTEVHEHHSNNAVEDWIAFDHKLYSLGKDKAGGIALYKITVEEIYQSKSNPDDLRFHNLRYVKEIEKVVESINGSSETHFENQSYTAKDVSTTKYSICDLYEFVKRYDQEFKPKPANVAFLNEDGTPKVLYHGTNQEWTQYDFTKNVNQMWGEGIYLTPDPKRAALYGDVVMPFYVKADTDNRDAKKSGKQRDYTIMKNGDVLVYSPKQIKSAKDNIGTFDGSNPDIRYKLPVSEDTAGKKSGVRQKAGRTQNTPYRKPAYDEWDVSVALDDALDHTDQHNDNLIKVGNMPNFITDLIGIEGDFYIYRNHAYENMVSKKDAEKAHRPVVRGGRDIHFHNLGKQRMSEAILALEYPIMTIADSQGRENPQVIMILPVEGSNGAPLYAALSFYSDTKINGKYSKRPHIVLTISERGFSAEDGYDGYTEVINKAIKKGNVLSIDKEKTRDYLSVIANHTRVGNITSKSLTDNIAKFREYVNDFRAKNKISYKLPVSKDITDREMLVDMFAQTVTDSKEYRALENYRKHIEEMQAIEEKLERINAEIRRLSFAEGPRDAETLNRLKLQQKQAVNRLNNYDNILLRLEKSGVLRAMIERNRKQITQESLDRARAYYKERSERREAELRQHYQESRRKAVERHDKAQIRQQIRKDVQRLDSLLNKGTKKRNVKLGLQEFVGAALRLAKGTFLNDYNEYDMIRNGLQNNLFPEEKAAFDRCRELLAELDELPKEPGADDLHDKWDPEQAIRRDDREEALKRELYQNMRILRDGNVFQRERAGAEDATAEQLADELLAAYQKLAETEFEHLQGLYSVKVYDQIEKTKNFLKGKAIKDMTAVELKELSKLYRMISETVSRADELFGAHRNEKTSKRGNRMRDQLATDRDADMHAFVAKLKEFGWSLLTPEAAAAVIGSDELTQAIREVEATETVQQQDLEHARQYAAEQAQKFNRKNWDTSKQVKFAGTEITIGQAMALFAYTERKAGRDHISGDGFVHSKAVPIKKKQGKLQISSKFIKDTTRAYRVTEDMYDELGSLLTEEQKGYARAMRDYLAEVMGAKGNEVSRELYGIDMYGEKFYFPLKSAKDFMDSALGARRGEVKVTNQGFTNPLQEGASNAIVLEDFESVWAKHVQEMSNYHASAVAMENFNRLYNYRRTEQRVTTNAWGQTVTEEVKSSETVSLLIERRAVGGTWYLTKWMENVNGGVRSDATEKLLNGLLGNFRKTKVLGNVSVIIQQPTAILRAVPYLGKDFLSGWKTWKTTTPEKGLIREMYRYCPVAGLKKMGGFDPSAGQTVRQYLFDGRDDAKGKLRKGVDKTNEFLGTAPEKMDELAWSYLWLGCKKKTLRENRSLRAGSKVWLSLQGQ